MDRLPPWIQEVRVLLARLAFRLAAEEDLIHWAETKIVNGVDDNTVLAIASLYLDDQERPSELLHARLNDLGEVMNRDQEAIEAARWLAREIIEGRTQPIFGAAVISGMIENRFDERAPLIDMLVLWADADADERDAEDSGRRIVDASIKLIQSG